MTVSLEDVMKKFTPEQRAQVEARTAQLIDEELTLRDLRRAQHLTQEVNPLRREFLDEINQTREVAAKPPATGTAVTAGGGMTKSAIRRYLTDRKQ